jgi:hypothetical protein
MRTILEKEGSPAPPLISLLAEIDTGSDITGFSPWVFQKLQLRPFRRGPVRTTTSESDCEWYDASVGFISGTTSHNLSSVHVIAAEGFLEEEETQGIIGRDILNLCYFQYFGKEGKFNLNF